MHHLLPPQQNSLIFVISRSLDMILVSSLRRFFFVASAPSQSISRSPLKSDPLWHTSVERAGPISIKNTTRTSQFPPWTSLTSALSPPLHRLRLHPPHMLRPLILDFITHSHFDLCLRVSQIEQTILPWADTNASSENIAFSAVPCQTDALYFQYYFIISHATEPRKGPSSCRRRSTDILPMSLSTRVLTSVNWMV
jgi:hypothetical protein